MKKAKIFIQCIILALLLIIIFNYIEKNTYANKDKKWQKYVDKLAPLHEKKKSPEPGDWLDEHKEKGQTFLEYVKSNPVLPKDGRKILYILPLGEFNAKQMEILNASAEFIKIYYGLPVKMQSVMKLDKIPDNARREHPVWKDKQILSTYLLKNVLQPKLPTDAAAYIALTTSDLWPGKGWNFVFGQANLRNRVGVWSIYRYGDPSQNAKSFRLCLKRAVGTATHETGHMFSIKHCIKYECNMNGSNSLTENDKQPLYLCSECVTKVLWGLEIDPQTRFKKLLEFCDKYGYEEEKNYYQKVIELTKNE